MLKLVKENKWFPYIIPYINKRKNFVPFSSTQILIYSQYFPHFDSKTPTEVFGL